MRWPVLNPWRRPCCWRRPLAPSCGRWLSVAHAFGLSFPSGHVQGAMAGYTILLIVFLPVLHGWWRRTAVTFAVVMVAAIGFSRIALGDHYVSDVVGGVVLGAAWVAAMAAAFNLTRVNHGRRPEVKKTPESQQESRQAGPPNGGDEIDSPEQDRPAGDSQVLPIDRTGLNSARVVSVSSCARSKP
ncbi:MAG: phosphatase PAP2 family protein [Dermatophilaceae bacterium]|nr:phosphatase PAP2 family protein [Dermatophilaceae bacterium]